MMQNITMFSSSSGKKVVFGISPHLNILRKFRDHITEKIPINLTSLVAPPTSALKRGILKSAFALPILDDKAMPNFYRKFVNC